MSNSDSKAIVIGATGLIGMELVRQLQQSKQFDAVTVVVRHEVDEFKSLSKVNQFVLEDFLLLNDEDLQGYTHAFSALGTTLKKAGSKQKFYAIDYEINAHFADLLQDKPVHFILLSSMGADASSIVFYNRVKGQLEDYVRTLKLEKLSFIRPSLLIGERPDKRLLEDIGQKLFSTFEQIWTKPFRYKPVRAEKVAKTMLSAATEQVGNFKIYDNLNIQTVE